MPNFRSGRPVFFTFGRLSHFWRKIILKKFREPDPIVRFFWEEAITDEVVIDGARDFVSAGNNNLIAITVLPNGIALRVKPILYRINELHVVRFLCVKIFFYFFFFSPY